MLDVCLHSVIDVESTPDDIYAYCVFCKENVSELVSTPGVVYTYDEKTNRWFRAFGGYGVKTDLLDVVNTLSEKE